MLLFDANLSPNLVFHLSDIFPISKHVDSIGLQLSDEQIWQFALEHRLIIVTKDNDFNKILVRKGFPPKIIQIKRGNSNSATIIALLKESQNTIYAFAKNIEAGILYLK
jgi:predicted nuclease of predicted toxin-antitoxin system